MAKRILHVVGARPNFMKVAPVMAAVRRQGDIEQVLVHTGQHYGQKMAEVFFQDLGLPSPDYDLEVGSGTHAEQTGAIMCGLEQILPDIDPQLVVVVGDVNSTIAAAIVSAKACVPVAHVEAGLRSGDRRMPEEINRIVTDRLSTLLLTPSRDADENLLGEGCVRSSIHFVGNVMIDSLLTHKASAPWDTVRRQLNVSDQAYAVLTLHRPANVDERQDLARLLRTLSIVGREIPIIFPAHPRTAKRLRDHALLDEASFLQITEPLGYLEFLALTEHAACVLTDSGGLQEETTVLGVPCFTLRENTERPVTITVGTNTLVGADGRGLHDEWQALRNGKRKIGRVPEKWDGRAGERIAEVFSAFLNDSTVVDSQFGSSVDAHNLLG